MHFWVSHHLCYSIVIIIISSHLCHFIELKKCIRNYRYFCVHEATSCGVLATPLPDSVHNYNIAVGFTEHFGSKVYHGGGGGVRRLGIG